MLTRVHVMGSYWSDDADRRSALGALVADAKDLESEAALDELRRRLVDFVGALALGENPVVVPVPPGPHRDAHPVPALAEAVAGRLGVPLAPVVDRRHDTPRLRDTPIDRRLAVVEAAGYVVTGDVVGRSVVLVDDVILTGTTLRHLAELLVAAGAAEIIAVVVCRTRLAGPRRMDG
ncbi:MAG: phosphoribosyltransferase family protein [Acidimicrobiales bacterium]